MKNFIKELEISNFKSIRNVKMDCKRINVLIGKPNVGKSNVLEALSMLCDPYVHDSAAFLGDYIRYQKLSNLFYDQDRKNQILVATNIGFAALKFNMNNLNSYDFLSAPYPELLEVFRKSANMDLGNDYVREQIAYQRQEHPEIEDFVHIVFANVQDGTPESNYFKVAKQNSVVKKYQFKPLQAHKDHFPLFLRPPYGDNLFTILEGNPGLWDECAGYFNQYGLDLLLDTENEEIEVQKKVDRRVTKIPYALAADTLQRFIFHLAAIETNSDSILLFEEPENHSFPPYISLLGEKIIAKKDNQFFIATHSPYLLTPFLEQCPPEEIAVFVASYENFETKIHALTNEEIQNVLETGIDLFFNISAFQE
jgi:hypothetical protein